MKEKSSDEDVLIHLSRLWGAQITGAVDSGRDRARPASVAKDRILAADPSGPWPVRVDSISQDDVTRFQLAHPPNPSS